MQLLGVTFRFRMINYWSFIAYIATVAIFILFHLSVKNSHDAYGESDIVQAVTSSTRVTHMI